MVSLGVPRQVSSEEWQCNVRIDGLAAEPILETASGVDSLQALLLGVEFLRASLRRSRRRLAWVGDTILCPSGGIPRQVPEDLGEAFDKRIEQLLDREEQRFRKFRAKVLRAYLAESTKKTGSSHNASSKPRRGI